MCVHENENQSHSRSLNSGRETLFELCNAINLTDHSQAVTQLKHHVPTGDQRLTPATDNGDQAPSWEAQIPDFDPDECFGRRPRTKDQRQVAIITKKNFSKSVLMTSGHPVIHEGFLLDTSRQLGKKTEMHRRILIRTDQEKDRMHGLSAGNRSGDGPHGDVDALS